MQYAIITVLALIIDQAVKYWVTVGIKLNEGVIPVIPGILSLVNIHNSGAAFGILENFRWLFVVLAVLFVSLVIFSISKNIIRKPFGRISAVLVMAGAIGNCIDRVINGYVVDMFRFDFINFAVFNVADILITVCGVLFCVYIMTGDDLVDGIFAIRSEGPKGTSSKAARPAAEKAKKRDDKPVKPDPAPVKRPGTPASVATPPATAVRIPPAVAAQAMPENPAQFEDWRVVFEAAPAEPPKKDTAEPVAAVEAQQQYASAPAAPAAREDLDFSLDDILAEYSNK